MVVRYQKVELARLVNTKPELVEVCLSEEWVVPAFPETGEFDDEDLARLRLIVELREKLGVNESGIDVALHLIDQLNTLTKRIVGVPLKPHE